MKRFTCIITLIATLLLGVAAEAIAQPRIKGNVYGGGENAKVMGKKLVDGVWTVDDDADARTTKVTINNGNVRGNVFGAGKGVIIRDTPPTGTDEDGNTIDPLTYDQIAVVYGNTEVNIDSTTVAPIRQGTVWGNIYGGAALAIVDGNTQVNIAGGKFAGDVFGGGKGDDSGSITAANVLKNTNVSVTAGEIIWDKKLDSNWELQNADVDEYFDGDSKKFRIDHNIYAGGHIACTVGTWRNASKLDDSNTGTSNLKMTRGLLGGSLLSSNEWRVAFAQHEDPHFYAFGGGYGIYTKAHKSEVEIMLPMVEDKSASGGNQQLVRPRRAPGDTSLDIITDQYGVAWTTVLGILGGGYNGHVEETNVLVGDATYAHRVYGGGLGSYEGWVQSSGRGTPNTEKAGYVGTVGPLADDPSLTEPVAHVAIAGGHIHGDVFGGGAGVAPGKEVRDLVGKPILDRTAANTTFTDFTEIARVKGNTLVETCSYRAYKYGLFLDSLANYSVNTNCYGDLDTEKHLLVPNDYLKPSDIVQRGQVFGNVYGGGDVANVTGNTKVMYRGGQVFGQTFGAGLGRLSTEANNYKQIGYVTGNAEVEITDTIFVPKVTLVNLPSRLTTDVNVTDIVDNQKPLSETPGDYICYFVVQDASTNPAIGVNFKPHAWDDVYGGGRNGLTGGNASVAIGGGYVGNNIFGGGLGNVTNVSGTDYITSADVLGNTNVTVTGGQYLWRQMADVKGNIKTFHDVTKEFDRNIIDNKMMLTPLIEPIKDFFDYQNASYTRDHSIYGGGNIACKVGTYASDDILNNEGTIIAPTSGGKSTVDMLHGLFADTDIKWTDDDTWNLATLCRYLACENSSNYQFGVFGGGFGPNTKVGETEVKLEMGRKEVMAEQASGDPTHYPSIWNTYMGTIHAWYNGLSDQEQADLYGGGVGVNAENRYLTARMARSINVPSHTVLTTAGGGLAGYVAGNTSVSLEQRSGALRIFGGGIGLRPTDDELATLDQDAAKLLTYGQVGGSTSVNVEYGVVVKDVFGGGAGIEPQQKSRTYLDFTNMARVNGNTYVNVHATNNVPTQTLVFGRVFGGGDVANVGQEGSEPGPETAMSYDRSIPRTKVEVQSGCVFNDIFAGGSGRRRENCNDYSRLGAVYGNTQLVVSQPTASDDDNATWVWRDVYGGGRNGTIYGNTLVEINGGWLGYNVFGGGLGNIGTVYNHLTGLDEEVITEANVTQNTNILVNGGQYCLSQTWDEVERNWEPVNKFDINGDGEDESFSSQYDPVANKFLISHNIYGGGNVACTVGNDTYVDVFKGLLPKKNRLGHKNTDNLFLENEWKNIHNKHASPYFSVFGGGYGVNTHITRDTNIKVAIAGDTEPDAFNQPTSSNLSEAFYDRQSVLDVIGGGYEGDVGETCRINVQGNSFIRNVFGGAYYATVGSTVINALRSNIENIYGGGMMGDVRKDVTINFGQEHDNDNDNDEVKSKKSEDNSQLLVMLNIYGANDVSGTVGATQDRNGVITPTDGSKGVDLNLYGGTVFGSVYGGGNGNYQYMLDHEVDVVTAEEQHPLYDEDGITHIEDILVYHTPVRQAHFPSVTSMSPAQKIVNISSYRPAVSKVDIDFKGNSTADRLTVKGSIFGGGCSASVSEFAPDYGVKINVGSHVHAGRVFIGSDGAELFNTDNKFMRNFQNLNGIRLDTHIDWDEPENIAIPQDFIPLTQEERKSVYSSLLDLYFTPVEMNMMPEVTWGAQRRNNSVWLARGTDADGNAYTYDTAVETESDNGFCDTEIGVFCCGGNRGNMNTATDFHMNFPKGLTITDAIIGGCNEANYDFSLGKDDQGKDIILVHEGGYLVGRHGVGRDHNPQIHLSVRNKFKIQLEKDANGIVKWESGTNGNIYPERCNVFGGCNESGTVRGDILIDVHSNMLMCDYTGDGQTALGLDSVALRNTVDEGRTVASIYGGGKGGNTWVYGDTDVRLGDALVDHHSNYTQNATRYAVVGSSCNYVFGGGSKGNIVGNTNVRIYNGRVAGCVVGASYLGTLYGNAQTMIGYPEKFYRINKTAQYDLERVDLDETHLTYRDNEGSRIIKPQVWYTKGDLVPTSVVQEVKNLAVYDNVGEYNAAHGTSLTTDQFNALATVDKAKDFWAEHTMPEDPNHDAGYNWNNVVIQIDKAIYGGGYAVPTGDGNTDPLAAFTVRRYSEERRFKDKDIVETYGLDEDEVENFLNYGGNTFVIIGDISGDYEKQASDGTPLTNLTTYSSPATDREVISVTGEGFRNRDHITLSSRALKPVNVKTGDDLFGLFYEMTKYEMGQVAEDDPQANDGSGRYLKVAYESVKKSDDKHHYYEFIGEGGVYGDGRLSLSQGFRTCEAIGYGYNGTNPQEPKLMNCLHRFDIVRIKDCCISLLGDKDYASEDGQSATAQAYSIARVGEVLMESSIDQTRDYLPITQKFSRNYIGLSNAQFDLAAIRSNVQFLPQEIWDKESSQHVPNPDYRESESLYHNKKNRVIYDGMIAEGSEELDGSGGVAFTDAEKSYYQVKQWYLNEYQINSNQSNYYDDVKAQVTQEKQFQLRNSATSKNMFGIFSGYALTVRNNYYEDAALHPYWGPVKGVFEVDLIGTRSGEAGGYAYAQNIHHNSVNSSDHSSRIEDPDVKKYDPDHDPHLDQKHLPTFLETSGNFVFPSTETRKIVDNCFNTPFSDLLRDVADGHYWYVTGFKYYYNATITGYTYDNKDKMFDMENSSHLIFMPGAKAGQKVTIQSFRFLNRHSAEREEECDIENRFLTNYFGNNTLDPDEGEWYESRKAEVLTPTAEQLEHVCLHKDGEGNIVHTDGDADVLKAELHADSLAYWKSVYESERPSAAIDLRQFYNLSLSISDRDTYAPTSYMRDKENTMFVDAEGNPLAPGEMPISVNVPHYETLIQDAYETKQDTGDGGGGAPETYKEYIPQNELIEQTLTINEPLISIQLKDRVNNNGKLEDGSSYYENYLDEPCTALLVLTTPAVNSLGQVVYTSYDAIPPYDALDPSKNLNFGEIQDYDLCYIDVNGDYVAMSKTDAEARYLNKEILYRKSAGAYLKVGDGDFQYDRKYYTLKDGASADSQDPAHYEEQSLTKPTFDSMTDAEKEKLYYYRPAAVEALYEYHITLTIQYIKGPGYDGHIDIMNCALPGEMIRLRRDKLIVESDQSSLPHNGSFWTIGPGRKIIDNPLTGEYHWELIDETGTMKVEERDSEGNVTIYDDYNPETRNFYYPYNPYVSSHDGKHYKDNFKTSDAAGIMSGVFENNGNTYIPAYYFMNGYVAQYSFTVENIDEVFTTTINPQDTLLVHNYHRAQRINAVAAERAPQDDKKYDIKLRKAVLEMNQVPGLKSEQDAEGNDLTGDELEAVQAANRKMREQWAAQHKRPRVYIQNYNDLKAFAEYVNRDDNSSLNEADRPLTESADSTDFFLLNDITVGEDWTPVKNFRGRFHGNGHVISGLNAASGYIFESLSGEDREGEVYNLGLLSGRITSGDAHTSKNAKYHCCYTYNTGEKDANNNSIRTVYRIDGTAYTYYTDEDWKTGRVAYDLNEYYLAERLDRHTLTEGEHEDAYETETELYRAAKDTHAHDGYVEDLYADGEYRYALYRRSTDPTDEWLRSDQAPSYNYGYNNDLATNPERLASFHYYDRDDEALHIWHDVDSTRAVYNKDDVAATYFGAGDRDAYNTAHQITQKAFRDLDDSQKIKSYTLYTYAEYKALDGKGEVTEQEFNALSEEYKRKSPVLYTYDEYVAAHNLTEDQYQALLNDTEHPEKLIKTPAVPKSLSEYRPLIDEAMVNTTVLPAPTAKRNDYLFFGQNINETNYNDFGNNATTMPRAISASTGTNGLSTGVTHAVDDQTNRVWRAYGFYHSKEDDAYHFNKVAWVLHPELTAIDFTGLHEDQHEWDDSYYDGSRLATQEDVDAGMAENVDDPVRLAGTIFYPKVMDMPEALTSFNVGNQNYVTKNLLVYTDKKATAPATDQSATAVAANNRINYNENTPEGTATGHILGHWIPRLDEADANGNLFAGRYLHLVERAGNVPGAGGVGGYSNDFNAPIAFTVTDSAWYVRQPLGYRNAHSDANHNAYKKWEGISLPFTAMKVAAVTQKESTGDANGEISHFYGDSDLHHEYWLRGFTAVASDANSDGSRNASFARPGISETATNREKLFYLADPAQESGNYIYRNDYFAALQDYDTNPAYGEWYKDAGKDGKEMEDYVYLTKEIPYIVAFPGNDYYEFSMEGDVMYDISSNLTAYDSHRKSGMSQYAVFEAPTANVLVSDDQPRTTSVEGYNHIGTFMDMNNAEYGMNAVAGEMFDSETKTVVPFRTYMTVDASPVKGNTTRGTIYIVEGAYEGIEPNEEGDDDVDISEMRCVSFTLDGLTVIVENGYDEDKQIMVFMPGGQLVLRHTAPNGQSTFRLPKDGLYIIHGKKVTAKSK